MKIESLQNKKVKEWTSLKEKKERDKTNTFLIEGDHLLKEAMKHHLVIEVITTEEADYEVPTFHVTKKVMEKITNQVTPPKVIAVTKKLEEKAINGPVLILDGIQDPGNLGTILRTADSIGLTQILVSKGTADCYNPKVVRSTMGAIFRVKIIECEDLVKTLKEIKKHKFEIVVSSLQTDNSIYDINYHKKVIVIGNEANGVKKEIQDLADKKIKIPMLGKTESLNASVATGIILYEYVRQKLVK